ncbi:DUF456 domain-containing protein [Lyngbya confervoides]|uniref:DUF456 family protein n=1 Tax=Lyngbya confervoides BDU141951 TaxID=1574623 RepID=A0ABD4T6F4_9CYAN|nr:DUF456 family protein [Lyngbya confervoides]MCM1984317.1 DUF456 family protein [Lyngbya confervoides BDU141951]
MAIYWLLVAVMGIGVVGAFVPGLPGMTLILACVMIWGLIHGFSTIGIALAATIGLWVLSFGVDFLATLWGMQKAGASKWGQIGAIIGMVAGFLGLLPTLPIGGPLGPLIGIFIGPLLGALIGEYLYCRNLKTACKAALGVLVSTLVGNMIQGFLAIAAMAVFLATTLPRMTAL